MKSWLIKSFIGCLMVICFSHLGSTKVEAAENQMQHLHIHVQLEENGTATITETREMTMQEGTELYIELTNLQDSTLQNFEVSDFEEESDWDLDNSREEKAGRYGVLEVSDGYELVWGIGEYGQNEYQLTYTLSNLVRELEDGQALFWDFNTFGDIPPEELTMEIEGPFNFTPDEMGIWGFGLEGDLFFEDGRVIWESSEPLNENSDVTLLLQFPTFPFTTQVDVDMTLEEQYEMATEGSAYNSREEDLSWVAWLVGGVGLVVAAVIGSIVKVESAKKAAGHLSPASHIKKNKGITYPHAPYTKGDISDIAYYLHPLANGSFDSYFFAYLLKWASEEKIHIEMEETSKFFGTKQNSTIKIINYEEERKIYDQSFRKISKQILDQKGEIPYEAGVWTMLLDAADEYGILDDELMKEWSKKHAKEVMEFAEGLRKYSIYSLENKGYVKEAQTKVLGIKVNVVEGSKKAEELADRIIQFKNYVNELDLKEAASIEQPMSWEELLIWSTLFGKSDEIVKQLEKFFPREWERFTEEAPYFYGGYHSYHGFRRSWSSGLASGGYDPAGGAGGSTSAGGGAGAGGGGGGGAR